jgi:GTP pyrophosphokinase
MFIAMSEDLRVIIVKLADRIHNMRTLDFHAKREKRDRIALETLNIYAPIADRLGIFEFKEILENECFRALYPEDYKFINRELAELGTQQEHFYENAKKIVADIIPEHIFVSSISFRVKSAYSIFKKMHRK